MVKKLPKLLLTYICNGDIVELHQESLDIQKTHPQTLVAQLGQVFLHTDKFITKMALNLKRRNA